MNLLIKRSKFRVTMLQLTISLSLAQRLTANPITCKRTKLSLGKALQPLQSLGKPYNKKILARSKGVKPPLALAKALQPSLSLAEALQPRLLLAKALQSRLALAKALQES
ncbi:hypothetical protein AAMO2058_001331000 [Amorphochlora amoebiformis]